MSYIGTHNGHIDHQNVEYDSREAPHNGHAPRRLYAWNIPRRRDMTATTRSTMESIEARRAG